ncbi:MAG: LysM peptidoglycan-binding domain-containing protein [Chloroflexota bacterium]
MFRTLLAALPLLAIACAPVQEAGTATATQTLRPQLELSETATQPPRAAITPVERAGPTPTPFTHIVEQGDTLLGVALQYGVELNELLLANPGVNPRFLSVGSPLVIPLSGAPGPVPTATPRPVDLSLVDCYGATSGELRCLLTAALEAGPPIEGLIALVTLVDAEGNALRTEPAFSPLNLLLTESFLPLSAHFAPPVPQFAAASTTVISAFAAGENDRRYLPLDFTINETRISEDRFEGTVSGVVALTDPEQGAPDLVRLVLLGFDIRGRMIGFTTWDLEPTDRLEEGLPFEISVFSLGPPLATLTVIGEARRIES